MFWYGSLTVTIAQRLEQFTNDVNTQAHAKDERTMQALSNLVSNTISIKLEKTVKNEMKQTVLSGLEKMQAKHLENSSNLIAQVPLRPIMVRHTLEVLQQKLKDF